MSNGILKRQNEEKSIKLLAAQKTLYKQAENIRIISMIISVCIPCVLSIIFTFVEKNQTWGAIVNIVSIVNILIIPFLDNYIASKKELAAIIQQQFDTYVFELSWDKRIFGEHENKNNEIVKYSKKIIDDNEKKKKLYDWYLPQVDNKELNEGILLCQRESVLWNGNLISRYLSIVKILLILLPLIMVFLGMVLKESIIWLIARIALTAPIIKWLLSSKKQLTNDYERHKMIIRRIDKSDKTIIDLQDIQKLIYEHRKNSFIIPDFIYSFYKRSDETNMEDVLSLESKKH